MESRDIFTEFVEKLAAAEKDHAIPEYPSAGQILLLLAWPVLGIALLAWMIFLRCNTPEEGANLGRHNPLPAAESDDDIADDPLIETRLTSVGMEETEMRDHPTIGFFFDPIKRCLTDTPVVLNTGDIVDKDTGEKLVRGRTLLPRGRVTGFFDSYALRNLLAALVDGEVEKRTQAKNK